MQVSEQIELKPCPFCGGGDCNTEGRTYSNKGQMFCHDCGASGPHPIYEVATWTSRAALAAAQPVVKPNTGACTIALHGNEITVVFDEREDAERAFNEIEATGRFSALSLPTKETSEC